MLQGEAELVTGPELYERVVIEERVGEHRFELVTIDGFERQTARLYTALRGRGSKRERADLSPMFGVIWGAARALADRVLAEGEALVGQPVLELGCGLALPSLMAAKLGARVVATDHHAHNGAFLEENLRRNGLDGRVEYARFDWRDAAPPELVPEGYAVVMASDVLFSLDQPLLAAQTFARFMRPGGVGWLTDPGRAWSGRFEVEARALGLEVALDVVPSGADEAFLFSLRRPL